MEKETNKSSLSKEGDDSPNFKKMDPPFFEIMEQHYTKKHVKFRPELKQKILELAYAEAKKNTLKAEEKLNNQEWLSWIKPMVFPMVENILAWLFKPSIIVAAMILIGITIGGFYYFNQKSDSSLVSNSKATIAPTPASSTNITEHNKTTQNNKIKNNSNIVDDGSNSTTIDDKQYKINNPSTSVSKANENSKLADFRKQKRPETPKNLDNERDTVAIVRKGKVTEDTNNNSEKKITLANLVNVYVLPLEIETEESEPLDLDISKELTNVIANNKKWKLSDKNSAEASFKKRATNKALILITNKGEILWEDKNYIENYKRDKNYIENIVKLLTKRHS